MLFAIPSVMGINYVIGVWKQGLFIIILTYLYNDLKGSDELIRDLIIAIAYGLFNHASFQLMLDDRSHVSSQAIVWICTVSAVILTTMQVQDLKDQAGDKTRNRKTIPLVFGERFSRRMIATCVMMWTIVCSLLWRLELISFGVLIVLGAFIAFYATQRQSTAEDALTWKLWCLWQASLYFLPVVHRIQGDQSEILLDF